MLDTVFFYIFATIILGGALLTITQRNAVHSAIFLIATLLGIAGLGARDIMGYCLLCLVFSGVVIAGGLYFLT